MAFRLLSLVFAFAFISTAGLHAADKKKKAAAPDYKSAIVVDAASGNVLYEQNSGFASPPASVTKLMTFAVVEDRIRSGNLSLNTDVTVTAADSKIGGTQVWLKEGEVFTVDELLYALMIQSANDAANALARAAGGTRDAFVEMMNAKAKELGMTDTIFRSPHGLPPSSRKLSESDMTSARDLAKLSRHLLLETNILQYTSVKEKAFGQGKRAEPVIMRNHNHLIGKVNGVDGLKTGFTQSAGFCLAATAQRNQKRIIAVIMGSPTSKVRDLEMSELIERGFSLVPANSTFSGQSPVAAATTATATPEASPVAPAPADVPARPTPTPAEEALIRFPGVKR